MLHAPRVRLSALLFTCALSLASAQADDNWQAIERRLPPPGIEISQSQRDVLRQKLDRTQARIDRHLASHRESGGSARLPDVEIFTKAVRMALDGNEFYGSKDTAAAEKLLAAANARLDRMADATGNEKHPRGLVVGGYVSQVDNSVQPFGLVVPAGLSLDRQVPLYIWLHGRDDKLTDLAFLDQRMQKVGQVAVDDAIVLHPFGRSCLGWKSAAEIDVLEAIDAVAARYPIDRDRIVLMGFSMGGAGAWHLGAHYAERWAAVHAGAGFVDVVRYQKLEPSAFPPPYEQALWGMYDVPDYVRNLLNLPVVAYSGELDKQKQAADIMAEALAAEGSTLAHLIGPGMGHKYAPQAWADVLTRMRAAIAAGRDPRRPKISLQTRTLRYSRVHWVEAQGLEQHWKDSRIDADLLPGGQMTVTTRNVTAIHLSPPVSASSITIDGQQVAAGESPLLFHLDGGKWRPGDLVANPRKRPGLQGPIDDAFIDPFLVVLPGGKSTPQIDRWVAFELAHFLMRWRDVYRGTLRIKRDTEVTDDDLARYHVVCWGDAKSNTLIARAADRLPLRWASGQLNVGNRVFSDQHLPLLIYPNPLSPAKYLVLNSGPTHREAHDRTNSLQNPKLPDWAVVDVRIAPTADAPGRVVAADFFDEQWRLRASTASPAGTGR